MTTGLAGGCHQTPSGRRQREGWLSDDLPHLALMQNRPVSSEAITPPSNGIADVAAGVGLNHTQAVITVRLSLGQKDFAAPQG